MNLLELRDQLETFPAGNPLREVRIAVFDRDGNPAVTFSVAGLSLIQEWADTPRGRRLEYKLAIIAGPSGPTPED